MKKVKVTYRTGGSYGYEEYSGIDEVHYNEFYVIIVRGNFRVTYPLTSLISIEEFRV